MTNFKFNLGIPDAPDDPSDDQPDMKINNDSAAGIWDIDHVGFNKNEGGTHNKVRLNSQTVNPTVLISQSALFQKIAGPIGSKNTELFYRYGTGAQNVFQITSNGAVSGVNGVTSLIGTEALPLKFQWGSFSGAPATGTFATGHATGTITFNTANQSYDTALYNVICIPFCSNAGPVLANDPAGSASVNPDISNSSRLSFRWVFNSNSNKYTGFYWIAVGS